MKPSIDYGPDCEVCGCKATNVGHHSPADRADPDNPLGKPYESMGGLDYYTWANVEYHEFQPPTKPHVHRFRCSCGEEVQR